MILSGEQGGAGHLGTIRSSSALTGMLIYNSLLTHNIIVVKNGPEIYFIKMLHHIEFISCISGLDEEFNYKYVNRLASLPL